MFRVTSNFLLSFFVFRFDVAVFSLIIIMIVAVHSTIFEWFILRTAQTQVRHIDVPFCSLALAKPPKPNKASDRTKKIAIELFVYG